MLGEQPQASSDNVYAQDKIAHNENIIYKCRAFGAVVFGILAGVFGLTSLWGLLVYVISSIVISIFLFATLPKLSIDGLFTSWMSILTGGFVQGAMTYVLVWTLAYDIVYIFF
ncbi:ER membrane protein complex subunit 6 [Acrasis kona]|uniref:ER membrane protein complex subunit 6 n=1 Tax=Acrasis kona TaxID=1008807 RepID=A0AAW2Z888_9EUKA